MLVFTREPLHRNEALLAAILAWTIAQTIKLVYEWRRSGKIDFGMFVSTGGMPSAHSAMVSALATSVGLLLGWGHPGFAIAAAFASIVMFDAQSVRRAAGLQARVLNQIVEELFKEHHLSRDKLAELLGHSRPEVFAGFCLGVLVAVGLHRVM